LNLLGLTWQLKPVEAPVLSHGLGTAGMPGTNDDTTGPSGGRGKQRSL
ncbi:teneurin-2 isoform X1, partial [Tachysurus ichikawai]